MTLRHYLAAVGQSPDEAQAWENMILKVAAKSGADVEKLSGIILRPLASGKVVPSDCHQLQEIGVTLSDSFMKLTPSGEATDKALFHELTRLGYNTEGGAENRG